MQHCPPWGWRLLGAKFAGHKHNMFSLLNICCWRQCEWFSHVHVSGVRMCVTAGCNQYIFYVREHLSHSKILLHLFGTFPQKQPPTLKRGGPIFCFFFSLFLFYQALTKMTNLYKHTPPMFQHLNTALCIKPPNAAAILAWGCRNFQGRFWIILAVQPAPETSGGKRRNTLNVTQLDIKSMMNKGIKLLSLRRCSSLVLAPHGLNSISWVQTLKSNLYWMSFYLTFRASAEVFTWGSSVCQHLFILQQKRQLDLSKLSYWLERCVSEG